MFVNCILLAMLTAFATVSPRPADSVACTYYVSPELLQNAKLSLTQVPTVMWLSETKPQVVLTHSEIQVYVSKFDTKLLTTIVYSGIKIPMST